MRYLFVLLVFLYCCSPNINNKEKTTEIRNESNCPNSILIDSLPFLSGIVIRDSLNNQKFERFIKNFNRYQYDYEKDSLNIRNAYVCQYSNFKSYNDSITRQHIQIDTTYLTIFHGLGFEGISQIFVVWNKCGENRIKFNCILDTSMVVGIGANFFKEIHPIGNNKYIIIGETGGGDAGDTWGSLWFAEWEKPKHMKILHEENYSTEYDGTHKFKSIDYKFDLKRLSADLTLKETTMTDSTKNEKTIYNKHIELYK